MWGAETFRLEPDIMTMDKALSSAYLPISAVRVNDRVYEPIAENSDRQGAFGHGFTYGRHPAPPAVAIEQPKIYQETDIVPHVRPGPHRLQGEIERASRRDTAWQPLESWARREPETKQ